MDRCGHSAPPTAWTFGGTRADTGPDWRSGTSGAGIEPRHTHTRARTPPFTTTHSHHHHHPTTNPPPSMRTQVRFPMRAQSQPQPPAPPRLMTALLLTTMLLMSGVVEASFASLQQQQRARQLVAELEGSLAGTLELMAGGGSPAEQQQQQHQQQQHSDYGVKLCGREFIRAVIYTCGGSRWRRARQPWVGAAESWDGLSDSELDQDEGVARELGGAAITGGPPEPPPWWISSPSMSRQRRDSAGGMGGGPGGVPQAMGLAGLCCTWGCSKGDISTLC
ncbi:uncharacterized protein LOC116943509 isoform X2 [Petromyzon marinus]|uniref:uncharacterized protein LOC116943509 isoform X2 n=1 Tax=Petromyzon marinus TaxID=7757 RepID=UPI003F7147B5